MEEDLWRHFQLFHWRLLVKVFTIHISNIYSHYNKMVQLRRHIFYEFHAVLQSSTISNP